MAFKQDYGMAMIRHGYKPGLILTWIELRAYNIDTIEPGKYCTTLELENIHAGHLVCCMTVDMDRERLVELLRVTDPGVAKDIATRLKNGEARIDLEESVRFMLRGELSKPMQGLHEMFAPITAKKIGPSPPPRHEIR